MSNASSFSLSVQASAQAFGDGSHPTTKGAMVALEALSHLQGIEKALDMGCGAGLLALQTAYQWHVPVVAVDCEQTALDATLSNAKMNQLEPLITTIRSEGFGNHRITDNGPYNLIIANILADILLPMAHDVVAHLEEEGIVVLSGILNWQSHMIEEAYSQVGLTLLQRLTVEDWVTLLFQKQ